MKMNPAWVDRILSKHWDAIEDAVGPALMPAVESQTKRGKRTFKEFGCGHYGCVMPTGTDNIVFKLTSDASEAAFVAAALSIGEFPEGIVRYDKIIEIPETHLRRRVFALWREEATLIGFPLQVYGYGEVTNPYIRGQWKELIKNLKLFQDSAGMVRNYVVQGESKLRAMLLMVQNDPPASWRAGDDPKRFRGVRRAMAALNECSMIAEVMEHTAESDQIGGAFTFYIEHGMLLADVHANNVGVVTRQDEYSGDWHGVNVITDPGHMVPLAKKWLELAIPKI